MAVPLVDLKAQYAPLRQQLDEALGEVLEAQRFILGPQVEQLEKEAAAFLGTRHAVGCASGTDALLLALKALRLEPGDEVVVPSFTFFATAGAVWNAGLRPAFADIDGRTFNVTAGTIEAALTERTRAVIVVHLYGQMATLAPIVELCRARGLTLIEDAAQAFGARQRIDFKLLHAGTIGALGAYSFFPAKILGGFGDGGMITTADDELASRLRKLRVHGGERTYHHEMVGTNSRLDTVQAAILRVKLSHVRNWIERRNLIAEEYDFRFKKLAPDVVTPLRTPENDHGYGVYTLRVRDRDALKAGLDARGIGNAVYYPVPLHLQECFAELGYREGRLPESERAAREVISLPVYPELTEAQVAEVVAAVREAVAGA
ncbi:MAG: DegT/DnrJ/EryC1/StrS family aminotransferase [Longimicrobiales bacterium]